MLGWSIWQTPEGFFTFPIFLSFFKNFFFFFYFPPPPSLPPDFRDKEPRVQGAAYVSWCGHLLLKSDLHCKINTDWCSDNVLTIDEMGEGGGVSPPLSVLEQRDKKDRHTSKKKKHVTPCQMWGVRKGWEGSTKFSPCSTNGQLLT